MSFSAGELTQCDVEHCTHQYRYSTDAIIPDDYFPGDFKHDDLDYESVFLCKTHASTIASIVSIEEGIDIDLDDQKPPDTAENNPLIKVT